MLNESRFLKKKKKQKKKQQQQQQFVQFQISLAQVNNQKETHYSFCHKN